MEGYLQLQEEHKWLKQGVPDAKERRDESASLGKWEGESIELSQRRLPDSCDPPSPCGFGAIAFFLNVDWVRPSFDVQRESLR